MNKDLRELSEYMSKNPSQRFWQALLNIKRKECDAILMAKIQHNKDGTPYFSDLRDTFNIN